MTRQPSASRDARQAWAELETCSVQNFPRSRNGRDLGGSSAARVGSGGYGRRRGRLGSSSWKGYVVQIPPALRETRRSGPRGAGRGSTHLHLGAALAADLDVELPCRVSNLNSREARTPRSVARGILPLASRAPARHRQDRMTGMMQRRARGRRRHAHETPEGAHHRTPTRRSCRARSSPCTPPASMTWLWWFRRAPTTCAARSPRCPC
jgi:hypothetical protein